MGFFDAFKPKDTSSSSKIIDRKSIPAEQIVKCNVSKPATVIVKDFIKPFIKVILKCLLYLRIES